MASLSATTPPVHVCLQHSLSRGARARAAPAPARPSLLPRQLTVARAEVGKDAVGSWIDLAGFVTSSGGGTKTPYDSLADKIGRDVYIDVAGWHLYLKDVKLTPGGPLTMAQGLAAKLGPVFGGQGYRESEVEGLVGKVPVKLGGGKATLPLRDLLPAACMRDLCSACEDYCRDL